METRNPLRRAASAVKRWLLGRRGWAIATTPRQIWSIGIYAGATPLKLSPAAGASNPVLTASSITDMAAEFVADPFMLRRGDRWHMFFEVMDRATGLGAIGLASSQDGLRWMYRRIVLREPVHLSYPYVFEWNGDVFMVPETHMAKAVRLYKSIAFPEHWSQHATLLEGHEYCDPSLFRLRDRWWLFVSLGAPPMRADTLRLYHARDLTGPWTEHQKSPLIRRNLRRARPAGRVLQHGGRIIRFAQDCFPAYGSRVRAFEITALSTTQYRERELRASPVLTPGREEWNRGGMHHVDAHRLPTDAWIAAVDGWSPGT